MATLLKPKKNNLFFVLFYTFLGIGILFILCMLTSALDLDADETFREDALAGLYVFIFFGGIGAIFLIPGFIKHKKDTDTYIAKID